MPIDFLERTLEDIVFENRSIIHQYGFPGLKNNTFRQLILPSGKKIDILSFDIENGRITMDIYELKRDVINTDAICQAYGYFIELWQIMGGGFKAMDLHIIMVGRYYEPIPIFEKMALPFSVFSYDYQLNGISFKKHQERRPIRETNENFCMGLWAFATGMLNYPNGQPSSVNLANVYADTKTKHPDIHSALKKTTGTLFTDPIIKEVIKTTETIKYVGPVAIKTEIFPPPLNWSKEFLAGLTYNDIFEDNELDTSDYEDFIEADLSDFEPGSDDEPEPDEDNLQLNNEIDLTEEQKVKNTIEEYLNNIPDESERESERKYYNENPQDGI
jgi:hypothetical protein